MDQSDDFEMKPLTPGLGFHKRQLSLKEHLVKTGVAQNNLRRSLPTEPPAEMLGLGTDVNSGGTFGGSSKAQPGNRSSREIIAELHQALKPSPAPSLKLTDVLPRDITEVKRNPRQVPEITPIKDQLKNIGFQIPNQSINEDVGTRRGASDNFIKPLSPVPVSFASIFLDSAIVLAFSLIFLMTLVMVTGVDLVSVAHSSRSEFATQLSLLALYLAVFEMYAIISRSFFGCTVGEWTFDLQLGDDTQIARSYYPVQVLWRSFLTLLTGLILLPVFSLLFRKDLAASLTGLQLYRKNV